VRTNVFGPSPFFTDWFVLAVDIYRHLSRNPLFGSAIGTGNVSLLPHPTIAYHWLD